MRTQSHLRHVCTIAAVFFLLLISNLARATSSVAAYNVTQLNPPGATASFAIGLNNANDVVGNFTVSGVVEGFLRKGTLGTQYTTVAFPGAKNFTRANGINDSTLIVGDFLGTDGFYHGFTLKESKYRQYDVNKGVASTSIFAVNNNGDFAGATGSGGSNQGFVYIGSTVTTFYANGTDNTFALAINTSDEVVGQYYDASNNSHGYSRGASGVITLIDYPGATQTACLGINDSGVISGWYVDSVGQTHGFIDSAGTFTSLPFFVASAINNAGNFVGWYLGPGAAGGVYSSYFANPTTLASFANVEVPGAKDTSIYGINDTNFMAGVYTDSSGANHGLLYSKRKILDFEDPNAQPGTTKVLNLNSVDQVVGEYTNSSNEVVGFIDTGVYSDVLPPGAISSIASGINNSIVVSGTYFNSSNAEFGFIFNGSYSTVTVPGSQGTWVWEVNDFGSASVQYLDSNGFNQSALYDGSTFTPINVPGAYNSYAHSIDLFGDIAFTWSDAALNYHAAVLLGGSYYVFDAPGSTGTFCDGISDLGAFAGNYTEAGTGTSVGFRGTL